jgi:hypothetical protein
MQGSDMDTTTTHTTRTRASNGGDGRSFAALFSDLWRETTTLVHEEAELAKADLSEKASQAASAASAVAVGGAIVFAGFLVLLAAACIALGLALPPDAPLWLSPLLIGAVVTIVGVIALASGRRKARASNLAPQRTIDSLRRDRHMVKEHLQ